MEINAVRESMELLSSGKEQREFRDSGPYKVKKKVNMKRKGLLIPAIIWMSSGDMNSVVPFM